jgi:hypothetical protein
MRSQRLASALIASCLLLGCDPKPADDSNPPEGDTDTDTDTDSDADTDWSWDHCPPAEDYMGDAGWGGTLQATAGAVYCGEFDEERTLEEELAAKAVLKVVEGSYPVPVQDGDHSLALPVCTRVVDGPGPGMAGAGTTGAITYGHGDSSFAVVSGAQPMDEGPELSHTLVIVGQGGAPPSELTLDGLAANPETGAGAYFALGTASGHSEEDRPARFASCYDPSWTLNRHTVTFDGGQIVLDLYIGQSMASTEPGAFVHAEGSFDGQAFDQDDYFALIYRPGHHHFQRNFAVLFDTAIGEVCGLRVEGIDPYATEPTATVSTAGCDLAVIEQLDVTGESLD